MSQAFVCYCISYPNPNLISNPISNSIPNPNPIFIFYPNPKPNPILNPIPNPNSISYPTPNPIPNPYLISISNPIPNPIPNPNLIPIPKKDGLPEFNSFQDSINPNSKKVSGPEFDSHPRQYNS